MEEFYFTLDRGEYLAADRYEFLPIVIGFRQKEGVWRKFVEFPRNGHVAFSPDGNRMYMAEGYIDREEEGWSARKSLGPMFEREDYGVMRLSASEHGTYVFDDYKSGDVIRISELEDGVRQEPREMSQAINTGSYTAHPFIAADESYFIWDSKRDGGYGDSDLYISFRKSNGTWGPALNMGPKVNSDKSDSFAAVTPDGKYILFDRAIDDENIDIYWVDAEVIERLRPRSP